MNFLSILKRIFPTPPTLDEYIEAHEPQTILDVEMLERQYEALINEPYKNIGFVKWN